MLYIIGLGLGDEKDITLRGLEAVKSCDVLFLEAYTSILPGISKTKLEEFYGKKIVEADRELVETKAEDLILEQAKTGIVGFLVVGDPFGATTHSDIVVRARQMSIRVEVIHNASIMNAVGVCGLQLYNFGQTVSMVFFTETWRPDSFYDKIEKNRKNGFHTLCLLDIKVKEPTMRAMMKGIQEYHPPRFMTVNTALEQLLEVEENRKQNVYNRDTLCVGMARVGTSTQKIVSGTMQELLDVDFGEPLHCLIICAEEVHFMEKELLDYYHVSKLLQQQ
jgi:diphthine synthase